jgi:hypothetical protein
VLLVIIGMLIWWRKKQAERNAHQDPSSYLEPYIPDMPQTNQTNIFKPSAPHHGAPSPTSPGFAAAAAAKDRRSVQSGSTPGRVVSPIPDMAEVDGTGVGARVELPDHAYDDEPPQPKPNRPVSGSAAPPTAAPVRHSVGYNPDALELDSSPMSPRPPSQQRPTSSSAQQDQGDLPSYLRPGGYPHF